MSERKQWTKPVIRKIVAGSAENNKTKKNDDGGTGAFHALS